jgi:hypothetical protein
MGIHSDPVGSHRRQIGQFTNTLAGQATRVARNPVRVTNAADGFRQAAALPPAAASVRCMAADGPSPPMLAIRNARGAALAALMLLSVCSPADAVPRRGTASFAHGDPSARPLGWHDLACPDPLALPAVAAVPVGMSPWTSLGNWVADGLSLVEGHAIHGNALALARAATPADRLRALAGILADRAFPVDARPFSHTLASGAVVHGTTLVTTFEGPPAAAPGPWLMLTAHFDKTGEGSAGFFDNAVSCAALVDLGERLRHGLMPGARLQLVFFDGEEQDLAGSRAFVADLARRGEQPDLVVNLDPLGDIGREIYVSASNSTHAAWPLADDRATARIARPTPANEALFIDALRAEADVFDAVQNGGTGPSDHLPFQFAGMPAVGIGVLRDGEAAEIAAYMDAYASFVDADQACAGLVRRRQNLARGSREHAAATAALAAATRQRGIAYDRLIAAVASTRALRRMHGPGDTTDLFDATSVNRLVSALHATLARVMARLPASAAEPMRRGG